MIESVFQSVHKVYTKYVGGGEGVGGGRMEGFTNFTKSIL